jgi:PleD family two-component response regulator
MTILIVEDNKASARYLELILQKDGQQTVMAYDAESALAILAKRGDIRLIIADVVMPKVDGIELLEEVRKNPAWADIPIIMCSSLRDMETVKKAVKSGCNHYMIKPIKNIALIEKIHEALESGATCGGG